jgi:hypothetical protein
MTSVEAYPLKWPAHRKRTVNPKRADFHRQVAVEGQSWKRHERLTIADGRDRVYKEMKLLGARGVVISSNLRLKLDGTPMASQAEPRDSGIAAYFQLNGQDHCLSCDAWDRAADNLAAIAKYVEAMRGQIRWGVADVASMFAGFKALPEPGRMSVEDAARTIARFVASDYPADVVLKSTDNFTEAYRAAARRFHPDANGGDVLQEWHQLQAAKQALDRHFDASRP